jgi:seryl-tRNA synthetase
MPGNQFYGEISSTSNCTDYQSRRLHIKSKNDTNDSLNIVHTLNGTACAIPRMLTCIVESNWDMVRKN